LSESRDSPNACSRIKGRFDEGAAVIASSRHNVGDVLFGVGRGADRIEDALALIGGVEMHQRHLHRLMIRGQRSVEAASVRSGLSQP